MACRQSRDRAQPGTSNRDTHPPPREVVVDAAGWLCALQLLSGIEGYVLPSGVAAPAIDFVSPSWESLRAI